MLLVLFLVTQVPYFAFVFLLMALILHRVHEICLLESGMHILGGILDCFLDMEKVSFLFDLLWTEIGLFRVL